LLKNDNKSGPADGILNEHFSAFTDYFPVWPLGPLPSWSKPNTTMKTVYITLFFCAICMTSAEAQITLLQAFHEPTVSTTDSKQQYDSTAALLNTTGVSQSWNFTSLIQTFPTVVMSENFSDASAVPSSSIFTGATLAGTKDLSNYTFYKSVSTPTAQFEVLGTYNTTATTTYSNSMVMLSWPMTYGSNYTDTYSGADTAANGNLITGTIGGLASGYGSITMPEGETSASVLQVRTTDTRVVTSKMNALASRTIVTTRYDYYEPTQRYPWISISYASNTDSVGTTRSASIWLNKLKVVGLNDRNFNATYQIYPNPAKDHFSVKLSSTQNSNCTLQIYNALGQEVKSLSLTGGSTIEENISIRDLKPGIYIVKTSLGERSSARRLIIE
jgi:hypothetical protein